MVDEKKIKYSASPFAPDWAKDPALRDRTITSFGKPLPLTNDLSSPFDEQSDVNDKIDPNYNQTSSDAGFHPTVEQIEDILWQDTDEDIQVYCIMDGYWADGLYGRLLNSPDLSWAHMFQGDVATRNVQQAPFIIALKRGHKLTKWLIEEGWGKGWGIYFTASTKKADLLYGSPLVHDKRFLPSNEEQLKLGNLVNGQEDPLWKMRRHFRQFSDVYLEGENKIVDFRYYDPWVLETWIESTNVGLSILPIGPITAFIYEHNNFLRKYYHLDVNIIANVSSLTVNKTTYLIKKSNFYYNFSINEQLFFKDKMDEKYYEYAKLYSYNYLITKNIFYSPCKIEKYFTENNIKDITNGEDIYTRTSFIISTLLFGLKETNNLYQSLKSRPKGRNVFTELIEQKLQSLGAKDIK